MLTDSGAAFLRLLPPEAAHRATLGLVAAAKHLLPQPHPDNPRLAVQALGLEFPNPIGLAAGFDKNAEVPAAMLRFGFGFVECGTVTPRPQKGNPRPRLFRLTNARAVINRMGFNSEGMEAVARRLSARAHGGIVGINIGANRESPDRTADYCIAFRHLAPFADYIAVNVSSPNTPGLRGLQSRSDLERLLGALCEERARLSLVTPLLLKIAPDLDAWAIDEIADVALASGIEGLIATNTTTARPAGLDDRRAHERGGLSGKPLFPKSTEVLKALAARTARKLVLIGAGGIGSGADAYAKIRAGASLVQLYTALVFEGPSLIGRIKRDLLQLLSRDGFASVSDACGVDA